MNIVEKLSCFAVGFLLILITITLSLSNTGFAVSPQFQRLDSYLNSDNEKISFIFFDESLPVYGLQPALTHNELQKLDALVDMVDPVIVSEFDRKFTSWLICWDPIDARASEELNELRRLLNCNGQEFKELIDFCEKQDDCIIYLFYQMAARANCPYDQLMLQPIYDLLDDFPEFSSHLHKVDFSLQQEKPNMKNRICNESTIWQIRKILEINNLINKSEPDQLIVEYKHQRHNVFRLTEYIRRLYVNAQNRPDQF